MCKFKIRFANDASVCCLVEPEADYCISNEGTTKRRSMHINGGKLKVASLL
jgi:hypothetical protein